VCQKGKGSKAKMGKSMLRLEPVISIPLMALAVLLIARGQLFCKCAPGETKNGGRAKPSGSYCTALAPILLTGTSWRSWPRLSWNSKGQAQGVLKTLAECEGSSSTCAWRLLVSAKWTVRCGAAQIEGIGTKRFRPKPLVEVCIVYRSEHHISTRDLDRLVQELSISKDEFAQALGLTPESLAVEANLRPSCTKRRLQQTLATLDCVQPWAGSTSAAWSWYRSQPIPALGGRTASELVSSDGGDQILAYLAALTEGGYS